MVPRDGRARLLDAGHVEQPSAAAARNGLLVRTGLAEARVLGLGVRADGREGDPGCADGAKGGFGHGGCSRGLTVAIFACAVQESFY